MEAKEVGNPINGQGLGAGARPRDSPGKSTGQGSNSRPLIGRQSLNHWDHQGNQLYTFRHDDKNNMSTDVPGA